MSKVTKVVLIKNAVETLGYFSEQIALELEQLGYDTYFIDYNTLYESLMGLPRFAVKGRTALLTFNFIGLGDEEIFRNESGRYIWEIYEMQYLNILVDHPLYCHTRLMSVWPRMTIFCVDREHVGYIQRFYPKQNVKFLPLAGNVRTDRAGTCDMEFVPYEARKYDLVFTANYVPVELLECKLSNLDEEYVTFYHNILDDLIANPTQSVDGVMERHILAELGDVPEVDMRAAIAGMGILDLYVRTYFRGDIIRELAEADIKVHVFGADWDKLKCKKEQNIIKNSGQVSSAVCVDAVRNAKIALNILPWFKDGAHDRIFTAMLQKTVALTDDSQYLRGEFKDEENIVFFSLSERKELPDMVERLLCDENYAMQIAKSGYARACRCHTWRARVQELVQEMK